MATNRECPECGAIIPPGSMDGFCSQCLFSLGLDAPDKTASALASPDLAPLLAKPAPAIGVKCHYFGDYELLEEIARGGMGVVFRARQISLNRTVAVKLITAGQLGSEDAVKRFHMEAEAAARLAHPNIVPIYEIGEHEGHHYFSMKLLEGGSLAQRLQGCRIASGEAAASASAAFREERRSEGGRKTPVVNLRESAALLSSVSRAVHYAHQRGILHRDLKPGNILLDEDGEPHVTDFGLAKLIESDSTLTHAGMVMGTPSYMSPEQAEGKNNELTTASDLWSLGTILYELLTGQPAFRGGTPMDTLRQVMEQEPTKPSALNLAVDRDLETITLKCLEKDPAGRYASAAALADDLEHWLEHEPILARRAGVFERVVKWARRQPMLAAAMVLLQIVLVAGVAGISWQWRQAVVARRSEAAERQRAVRAEGDALDHLRKAQLNYVRANRLTGQPGQRFDSLAELARAATRTNSLELRNEAIACFALPDLRPLKQWAKTPRWDSFKFSASHRRYMTNDASGKLTVRDAETDAILFQITGQDAKYVASSTAISPDDRFVATVDQAGQARLWDGSTQSPLVIDLPRSAALLTFTPDSRALVVKQGDSLHFLNTTNGVDEKSFPGPANLQSIQFDSSGAKFLTIAEDRIIIRQASDGSQLRTITRPQGTGDGFRHAAWHPDGRRLTASWQNNIGFWDSETGRQLAVFELHDGPVMGLAFSGAGQYLAIASWDYVTRLLHTETYHEVLRLSESGIALAISTDDRRLSLAPWGNKQVKLYELADVTVGQRVALPPPPGQRAFSTIRALFSPNSELVMACDSAAIYVFHASNHAVVQLPVTETSTACFAPDGKALLTGGGNGAQKWPLNWSIDRSELHLGPPGVLAPTHGLKVDVVELSRDGQWLLVMNKQKRGTALNLQMAPPFEVVQMDKSLCACFHLDVSPDGRWIASVAGSADALQIWNGRTGGLLTNIPSRGAWQCAFSSDGKWLACGQEDSTTVWDTTDWSLRNRIPHSPHDGRKGVTFSPDGRTLAVFNSNVQKMQLLKLETGEELASFPVGLVTTSMRFSPTGDRLAVANERGYVQLWDLRRVREQLAGLQLDWDMPPYPPARPAVVSRQVRLIVHAPADSTSTPANDLTTSFPQHKEPLVLEGHKKLVRSVGFSPDSQRIVTCSDDWTARVWEAATGKEMLLLKGHTGVVRSAAFSTDGQRIATGSEDGTAKVWDAITGKELVAFGGHLGRVYSVAFSPDSQRIVTGGEDRTSKVWNTATGKELFTLGKHDGTVRSVAFSPDGRRIVSGGEDGAIVVWDANDGGKLRTIRENAAVYSIAFAPDSERIVCGLRGWTVGVWDVARGKALGSLLGHKHVVRSVGFSPDGHRIVTGSDDQTVKLWEASTGSELLTFKLADRVASVTFSPDGRRIATGTWGGAVMVWEAASVAQAKAWPEE